MICRNCNSRLPDTAHFCLNCGHVVEIPSTYGYGTYDAKKEKGRKFATASLVLGIFGIVFSFTFIVPLLALIFGIIGVSKSGGGKAVVGIVLGALGIALGILVVFFLMVSVAAFFFISDTMPPESSIQNVPHGFETTYPVPPPPMDGPVMYYTEF